MIVGFTGTRDGFSFEQMRYIADWLREHRPLEAHHGDCIGADQGFHGLCVGLSLPKIVVHPPKVSNVRGFCKDSIFEEIQVIRLEPKPYLDRNHDIVNASDVMIASPKEMSEVLRSGTWATIRYAKKQGKPLVIVYPDGSTEKHNWRDE